MRPGVDGQRRCHLEVGMIRAERERRRARGRVCENERRVHRRAAGKIPQPEHIAAEYVDVGCESDTVLPPDQRYLPRIVSGDRVVVKNDECVRKRSDRGRGEPHDARQRIPGRNTVG